MSNNKKHILFCSPLDISFGSGIARWAQHIQTYYNKQNCFMFDIDFCSMDRTIYIDETTNSVKRAFWGIKDYFKIIKRICRNLNVQNYNIVHLVSSASISLTKDIFLLNKLKKKQIKSVLHFHFGRIPELYSSNNWEWKLIVIAIKLAQKVIVIDRKSYDILVNLGFNHIELLPNPLTPIISNIVIANNDIKREEKTILFVGHVYKTKGIYELVEASSNISNIKLKVVGKYIDNIKNELINLSKQFNNNIQIEFLGSLSFESVIQEMLRCTIFVLPTYTEGFPNVILESMACGCAIITTPVGAIPEMLDITNESPCGICVPIKDKKSLKEAIEYLLSNPHKMEEYRIRAKARVYNEYSMCHIWKNMTNIWNEM